MPPPSASASTTRSDKKKKAAKADRKPATAQPLRPEPCVLINADTTHNESPRPGAFFILTLTLLARPPLPSRERVFLVMLNSFQHLFFLSMPTYTTLFPPLHTPNCHTLQTIFCPTEPMSNCPPHTPNCHAELVSASHIFHEQRQADKWNNEILKQVQDDIFFFVILSLIRESGQTTAPVIASKVIRQSPSPRHCERSEAIQSDNYSL